MRDLRFEPEPQRTAAVDRAIRRDLADSVAAILDEMERAGLAPAGDRDGWRERVLARPAPPRLWARYHALVGAVCRLDEPAILAASAALLAGLPAAAPRPGSVLTLSEAHLRPRDAALYRAVIDSDPERPLHLRACGDGEIDRLRRLDGEARSLLAACCPALADEIDVLGHEIVLATGAGPRGFGGAATVFLWGAVVLNPERVPDRITLVESLAHECAHALLSGLTGGADLTRNGPDAMYASPLRPDPRPIEGIVHATFVLARMVFALDAVRTSAALTPAEAAAVDAMIARNLESYGAGLAVVDAHARFTPDGAAIMAGCRAAMRSRRTAEAPPRPDRAPPRASCASAGWDGDPLTLA